MVQSYALLEFFKSSRHLLSSIESSHGLFKVLLFKSNLAVSFQQSYNCNLAFQQGQMLPNAISSARTKRKETELLSLSRVACAPPFRVELIWVRIKFFLKMIGPTLHSDHHPFLDWNAADVMIFHC